MPSKFDSILRVVSDNLIPLLFTWLAPFCDLFSQIFIRDKTFLHKNQRYFSYLIVGQSFLFGPLAALVMFLDLFFYGRNFTSIALLLVSSYLLIYILFVVIFLRMGADMYDRQVLIVKRLYALAPACVMTLSVILTIVLS
jgi:hypothetical protein